ncbi:hypothetical protein M8818_001080 [Zalaria obscura]|uniref:Uncharacterized protein n=1 Tax=Zalaria obscura TaxID=2024903 RepID=A0ACC3SNN4_9PEZI
MIAKKNLHPTVLDDVTLLDFVQYIMDHHITPTTLIVCSSREAFLQDLWDAICISSDASSNEHHEYAEEQQDSPEHSTAQEHRPSEQPLQAPHHPLLEPTLRLLSSSRTIQVAFCPDLLNLQAYLASLPYKEARSEQNMQPDKAKPMFSGGKTSQLAILNLIRLHRPTSSFSAQGLNRTLAAAVDSAHRLGRKLLLAECGQPMTYPDGGAGLSENDNDHEGEEGQVPPRISSWDEEVSILNVTTKSFGAGERGWVGRTVQIRRVAQRWCKFEAHGRYGTL